MSQESGDSTTPSITKKENEMMQTLPDKKVRLELVGLDGNSFALMGAFSRQARKEGWSKQEIDQVLDECKSGDYDHLLTTLMSVTESPVDEEEEEGEEEEEDDDELDDEDDDDDDFEGEEGDEA